jgi:hypothetical protein
MPMDNTRCLKQMVNEDAGRADVLRGELRATASFELPTRSCRGDRRHGRCWWSLMHQAPRPNSASCWDEEIDQWRSAASTSS